MMSELFDEEYQRAAYNRASNKEAIAIGRAEGKAEERQSIAEKMRAKGYSEQEIAELLS